MSLKLFCTSCHKFIKNMNRNELGSVKDNEICPTCATRVKLVMDNIESTEATLQQMVAQIMEEIRSMGNQMMKRMVEPDVKTEAEPDSTDEEKAEEHGKDYDKKRKSKTKRGD